MGLEELIPVADAPAASALVARLEEAGVAGSVAMVDGRLVAPGAPLPEGWRELRLRTAAGMVTLARRADGLAVLVFGNADAPLRAAQAAVVAALRRPG